VRVFARWPARTRVRGVSGVRVSGVRVSGVRVSAGWQRVRVSAAAT